MKGTRAVRAIAVDYYGTLVDVGRPFDVIRRWFASTYRFPPAQERAFFMCFSKERAGAVCLGVPAGLSATAG